MRKIRWTSLAILTLLPVVPSARADGDPVPPAPPPATPEATSPAADPMAEFTALKAEFDAAQRDFQKLVGEAKTDAERTAAYAKAPKADDFAPRFRAIAAKAPKGSAAASCHAWIAQTSRTGAIQAEALTALLADHLASPAIPGVCQSLQYSQAPNAESFLRTVLEKSADHEAKGRACYTLARIVAGLGDLAARVRASDAAFRENIARWYGKAQLDRLVATEPAAFAKEAADLFDRVVESYGDLKYGRGTLAARAKGDLFEIRSLAVGMTAPEIEGEDHEGVRFKLSDFRGKVVMLDFWGEW